MSEKEFVAFIGIDWADKKHDICMQVLGSDSKEKLILTHKVEKIDDWVQSLKKRFGDGKVAVALEQSRGALIAALLKYDLFVIYPVNPATLANYRQAFTPSRAKDDPTDAEFLVELLIKHRERLRVWKSEDEKTRKLQHLVEYRRSLLGERTRLSNKLTAYLKLYYPQVLEWFPDIKTNLVCEFLLKWHRVEALRKVRVDTLMTFFTNHGSRNKAKNEQRVEEMKTALALTKDEAIIQSTSLMVKALCSQMKAIIENVTILEKEIASICEKHSDYEIFSSLPGAGEVSASRMLAAFGTSRDRFKSADEAARFFGIAPVMERSGNQEWVRWRYFCPKFLRQSFHEFSNQSIKYSFWAGEYYKKQRAKGKSHHVVIRALSFKWLRIIFRCWQDKKPYSENTYLKALQRNSSALLINNVSNNT